MPSRNITRTDLPESFYHVYARGASKQPIFLEAKDYTFFIRLLARYLSRDQASDKYGSPYPNFHDKISLLAYCLMGNHFHLLVYQTEQGELSSLMKSLMTSYSRYFNHKYKRTGSLYENRYKASLITDDAYLMHISRYIHLNPRNWRRYPYSSINYYRKGNEPSWLNTRKVLAQHASREDYIDFVADYEDQKATLEEIKQDLADR